MKQKKRILNSKKMANFAKERELYKLMQKESKPDAKSTASETKPG